MMLFHYYFVVVCRVVVCDLVRVLYRVVAHTISSVTVLLVSAVLLLFV